MQIKVIVQDEIYKPVTKLIADPDGTVTGIYCADGTSYDGYDFDSDAYPKLEIKQNGQKNINP